MSSLNIIIRTKNSSYNKVNILINNTQHQLVLQSTTNAESLVDTRFVLRRRRPNSLRLAEFDILVITALDQEVFRVEENVLEQFVDARADLRRWAYRDLITIRVDPRTTSFIIYTWGLIQERC